MFKKITCPRCLGAMKITSVDTTLTAQSIKTSSFHNGCGVTTVEYHCPNCDVMTVIPYATYNQIVEVEGIHPVGDLIKRTFRCGSQGV